MSLCPKNDKKEEKKKPIMNDNACIFCAITKKSRWKFFNINERSF